MHKYPRSVPGPVHDLATIQRLIREGPAFGLAYEKGVKAISAQRRCTAREARQFAAGAILSLVSSDYSDSIEYADGAIGDVYGKVLEDQGWYIKVAIAVDPERADIMSCHLAMHPIATESGTVPRAHRW